NKRHEPTKVYAAAPVGPTGLKPYTGTLPYCSKYDWHHTSACAKLCKRCKKRRHEEKECRFRLTNGNPQEVECWECGVSYEVELADGKIVSTNTILQDCTLELLNHEFKIDLLPTRLGSFDVIVGMDLLARYHAVIICDERIVCIPLPDNHILDIYDERPNDCLNSLSCVKAVEKKPADIRVAC
nr:reverse transcriptase domain-containing protein [Tanacetum cinerariifolium]